MAPRRQQARNSRSRSPERQQGSLRSNTAHSAQPDSMTKGPGVVASSWEGVQLARGGSTDGHEICVPAEWAPIHLTESARTNITNGRDALCRARRALPIYAFRDAIVDAVSKCQFVILVGETGSGKTTQLPQYLFDASVARGKRIACTQPRRVAATSVALRVAEEMDTRVGDLVGYTIRFDDCTSPQTVIKYMTDGILLRECLQDPLLSAYSVVIIDEAHERTVHTDVLFGLIKGIVERRPDLRVIVASATIEAEVFAAYFSDAPIICVPGRCHNVDIYYTKEPEPDYVSAAIRTCMQIHLTPLEGDILVFLTGQDEIECVHDSLVEIGRRMGKRSREMVIARVYSNMPSETQSLIFAPTPRGSRKIVLATNIAETSITIDGIVYVIDCGFVKQKQFNALTGTESLEIVPCSQASANQRAGRAGRVMPGKCFRLYTRWSFEHELQKVAVPEIQRTNLCALVLMLKSLGIDDLLGFPFMDAPPQQSLLRALEELYATGALDPAGGLTRLGRRMAEFPVEPHLAKTILAAEQYGCVDDVLSIVALLSLQGGSLFYAPRERQAQAETAHASLASADGDHISMLNVWRGWCSSGFSPRWCTDNFVQYRSMRRARDIRMQLSSLARRAGVKIVLNPPSSDNSEAIRKSFLAGYFFQVACLARAGGESYRTVKHGRNVFLHPSSALAKDRPKWVVYHEIMRTSKEYMRTASVVEPGWLLEAAPHYFESRELTALDSVFRSAVRQCM